MGIYYPSGGDGCAQLLKFYNMQKDRCNEPLGGRLSNETADDMMRVPDMEAFL